MAKQDPEEIERRLKQEAEDEALAKKLDSDPQFAKDFDDSFVRGLSSIDDELIERFAQKKGYSASETEAMKAAARRAAKAMKGGFFSAPRPEEANEIIMGNRGMREMKKAKGKGCAVVALLMVTVSGATTAAIIWGAVEAIAAVLS